FTASLLITAVLVGVAVRVGTRRPPGTPLTWGEAFVASTFLFALMLLIYGVIPDQWLRWADGGLKWRSDKIGIPMGPLPFGGKDHLLFDKGIEFGGRGRIIITAQVLRDIVAAGIYVVFLVGQIIAWLWWQGRGKKPVQPAIETSAYGRPLLRKAETAEV
ncbi:MAG: type transport system permease protein, partial [Acidimicrobiaceae bacterium]|nr:type transport system permease protein [Acidimicrobiaceae bacterium]